MSLPADIPGFGRRGFRPMVFVVLAPIRLYRLTLSAFIGRGCRYLPTCAEYAEEAVAGHGAWAGGWMALARVSRCHPLGASGYDPVPGELPETASWYMPWRYGRWSGHHIESRREIRSISTGSDRGRQ